MSALQRKNKQSGSWRDDPAKRLLSRARTRAKELHLPFDLVKEDLFIPEYCPVLGIKLDRAPHSSTSSADSSMSIDRLVPSRGYVRGNVAVISHKANRLKNNGTAAELERIAAWMRSQGLP